MQPYPSGRRQLAEQRLQHQRELLDRRSWATRAELASAIFEWIEGWYNPRGRHTSIGDLSPIDYERLCTPAEDAA